MRKIVCTLIALVILLTITYVPEVSLTREPITVDGLGYEWVYDNVFVLDSHNDLVDTNSFYYTSRDVIAAYYAVGSSWVFLRLDFFDLAYGAEVASRGSVSDALNIYILMGWSGAPGYQAWLPDYIQWNGKGIRLADYHWVLALAIYDSSRYRVYDYNWNIRLQNSGLQISFNSQWDLIEIGVPTSLLSNYGWTPTTTVWFRIVTTIVYGSTSVLADMIPNSVLVDRGTYYEWSGAVLSNNRVGTAKVIILHHGNQHLTDNRGLNPPNSRNSYRYILTIHEQVSDLARRPIPVSIHISGTLLASWLWWEPDMIRYVRTLLSKNYVGLVGGVWAEYITAYFQDYFNSNSAYIKQYYYQFIFGYTPRTAWIPERTWDDDRTGIASSISRYYRAVILDGRDHHDNWHGGNDHTKPHRYDTRRTGGRTLYVFFIDWDMQQLLLANTDGGLHIDLRARILSFARSSDQQHVLIYADDWEKAAGIADWDPGGVFRYENSIRWIAQRPWIQVITPDTLVSWLDSGSWTPVNGYYCGYDTYYYLKTWVQGYPYDYRRAYDGWYWGTNQEESFAALGASSVVIGGSTVPGRLMPDTIYPLGDVFGYTSYQGSPSNTILYRLLRAGGILDSAPRNEIWWLALITANSMLYETAWHHEDDPNGDGRQDTAYWGRWVWNHVRWVNVLVEAAKWLDNVRKGLVSGTATYIIGDFDWDGKNEVIVYNNRIWFIVDDKGGGIPYVFRYNPTNNVVYMGVGAPAVFWTIENDRWYGFGHWGLFVDDYYAVTGKNYYDKSYSLSATRDSVNRRVIVYATPPDLNNDGRADFTKRFTLSDNSVTIYVYYQTAGTLYVSTGLSVDFFTNLFYGDVLQRVNSPTGTSTFGYRNTVSRAYVYIVPYSRIQWTGTQDLVRETFQYRAKLVVSNTGSNWAIAYSVFTFY
ncbi:MAG: glycoside hydrolase [Desulfurococcaceae archaeon]